MKDKDTLLLEKVYTRSKIQINEEDTQFKGEFAVEMMIKEVIWALERFGIPWDKARNYLSTRFETRMGIVDKYAY